MMKFTEALSCLKGSKNMVARQIWEDKALISYKGDIMTYTLSTGVRELRPISVGDTDAEDWSVIGSKSDEKNYANSILHERIKTFIMGKAKREANWNDSEFDNLRSEVEQFVDIIHARINGLNKQ